MMGSCILPVQRLTGVVVSLERTEARSKEDLERRRQSRKNCALIWTANLAKAIIAVYTSLLTHRLALTRLRSKAARLQADLDALHGILDDLAKGYNPNYQDMAVKAAVVGFQELNKPVEGGEEVEEEIANPELDELEKKDLEGLLLMDGGDESEIEEEEGGIRESHRQDNRIYPQYIGSTSISPMLCTTLGRIYATSRLIGWFGSVSSVRGQRGHQRAEKRKVLVSWLHVGHNS